MLILRSLHLRAVPDPVWFHDAHLLVGDFILVEKFAYGLRDPRDQHQVPRDRFSGRGDVVVFKYPLDTGGLHQAGGRHARRSGDLSQQELMIRPKCESRKGKRAGL